MEDFESTNIYVVSISLSIVISTSFLTKDYVSVSNRIRKADQKAKKIVGFKKVFQQCKDSKYEK